MLAEIKATVERNRQLAEEEFAKLIKTTVCSAVKTQSARSIDTSFSGSFPLHHHYTSGHDKSFLTSDNESVIVTQTFLDNLALELKSDVGFSKVKLKKDVIDNDNYHYDGRIRVCFTIEA